MVMTEENYKAPEMLGIKEHKE